MIEIENVSFGYPDAPILKNISLNLPKGGLTALVGPNGAGKSTLLALMARLLPLQSGRIAIDGFHVDRTPGSEMAKRVAILRQDAGLASRLTVRELIGFGRYPHHLGRPSLEDRRIVGEVLARFNLEGVADRRIETLSGGQRQRAFVAMTLAQDTDYLLLDEPLNNLDMFHARSLMRDLRTVVDKDGRSIVIVLHDINHAAAYADTIVVIKSGSVIACGPTREVLKPETLEKAFGYQMSVQEIDGKIIIFHYY